MHLTRVVVILRLVDHAHAHARKNKRGRQAPYRDRVNMCHLSFDDIPNVVVSEAERVCYETKARMANDGAMKDEVRAMTSSSSAAISVGTSDLLDMLTVLEPHVDFTLALGTDAFVDLASGTWKRTDDIFDMVGRRIVVLRRRVGDMSDSNTVAARGGEEWNPSSGGATTGNDAIEGLLAEGIARWSRRVDDGYDGNDDDGRTSTSTTTKSSIRIVNVPTLSSVSSTSARSSNDVSILAGMLSVEVLEYARRNRMYAFAHDEEGRGG
jgi:nicotinic acid mononucleotide adenylyltransferase